MIIKEINAIGDACPIPVVKTLNAIKELGTDGGIVITFVDNEIAVQNLTKTAKQKGFSAKSEKISDYKFKFTMQVGSALPTEKTAVEAVLSPDTRKNNTIVVISSKTMGDGDEKLGSALMKSFIYTLSQQDELPKTMLFYNSGAYLTCEDSPTLEDLKYLETQGVEILTCGTCLNHYNLSEKLLVGSVTNMYVIVEKMTQASLIVKP